MVRNIPCVIHQLLGTVNFNVYYRRLYNINVSFKNKILL